MKLAILAIALVFAGVKAQEHPPDRGAVPCFYWDGECTSSYGVDFPGNDIAIYRTATTTDCCDRCKATEGCFHWIIRPNTEGGFTCHLKSKYGFPTYCRECIFSYTKSEACKQFCETTCHNLNQFGPAVCGTDGYTYESPCQMECTAVEKAADGECDSPYRPSVPYSPPVDTEPLPHASEEPTAPAHEASPEPTHVVASASTHADPVASPTPHTDPVASPTPHTDPVASASAHTEAVASASAHSDPAAAHTTYVDPHSAEGH